MYVQELHARYRRRHVRDWSMPTESLQIPRDAARIFANLLRDEVVEVAGLLCLSARLHVIAYHELSRGTLDATVMHPRDVFRIALLANARTVILGHNHPSGEVTPSPEDRAVTSRIVAAGAVIGIELLDHFVVAADGKYLSFKESGLL